MTCSWVMEPVFPLLKLMVVTTTNALTFMMKPKLAVQRLQQYQLGCCLYCWLSYWFSIEIDTTILLTNSLPLNN